MPIPAYTALIFTVALLVTTAYFLMGGLPLLILKHDTPVDQRFIQRFFDIYYKAALFTAVGAAISYALWGRFPFAIGTAVIAGLALLLQSKLLPTMAQLSVKIQAQDSQAVQDFRKMHGVALAANLTQLVALVWGLTQVSL